MEKREPEKERKNECLPYSSNDKQFSKIILQTIYQNGKSHDLEFLNDPKDKNPSKSFSEGMR